MSGWVRCSWACRAKTCARVPAFPLSTYDRVMDRLAAIVAATNQPPTLATCLNAIESAAEPPEEVIVVSEPAGLGPAGARNRGAARAGCELLVFVDSDVVVHPDVFVRIRQAFVNNPDVAAVFGAYDDDPAEPDLVSGFRNLLHHHVHTQGAGPAPTFWAGLGAIRARVFEEVGGFDEGRYPSASIEDIELGARLHARGYSVRLDPMIQGKHLKRWTLSSMIRTDFRDRGIPWAELVLAREAHRGTLNLGARHRLSALTSVSLLVSLGLRRYRTAAASAVAFTALNRDFYLLVARRRGALQAGGGLVLHVAHSLTATAAAAVAVWRHAGRRTQVSSRGGDSEKGAGEV
jgi:glycosyltransferase involved in cell wall biosynthesis